MIRGQVPFRAAGREFFLQYGTRELAEAQAALGFRRPSSQQPDIVEEADVVVEDSRGQPKLDDEGQPTYRRQKVLVNAVERQRRVIAGFEACLLNPDPEAVIAFIRIGLRPWQRSQGVTMSEEQVQEIVNAVGLTRLRLLHMEAISLGSYLTGDELEEESGSGKAESAVPASST